MDPFLLTLLLLLVVSTVLALVRTHRRDPCLQSFDGFHVTLAEKGGNLTWGKADMYSSGIEITYHEPVRAREGHRACSYIFYKDQYEAMDALYRYAEALSDTQRTRREFVIRRTVRPGPIRKLGRRIQNWISMIRDALLQAVGMVLGMVKTRTPGTAVLSSQEAQIKALSQEVIGHVGNAYDPLLERHLFSQVVVEITRNGRKRSYCGWLKNYTSNFIELVDVTANAVGTDLPPATYAPGDDGIAGLSLSCGEGCLKIVNESPYVLFVKDVFARDWTRPMGCVVPDGYVADLQLPPGLDVATLRVRLGTVDRMDLVVPRAHALIRHAGVGPRLAPAAAVLTAATAP